MGGFIRAITRAFTGSIKKQPPQQVQYIKSDPAVSVSGASKMAKVRGQGSGITGTIMTDATGIEEEANVSKTVLGGTTTKKKKYKV